MCRSIQTLRGAAPTDDDVHAAALQYVRKISGYRQPSRRNTDAFTTAVADVAAATERLLAALGDQPLATQPAEPAKTRA